MADAVEATPLQRFQEVRAANAWKRQHGAHRVSHASRFSSSGAARHLTRVVVQFARRGALDAVKELAGTVGSAHCATAAAH
jgi:hypothetical protein